MRPDGRVARREFLLGAGLAGVGLGLAACVPSPSTPTPVPTAAPTPTPGSSAAPTATLRPTPTPAPSATPTPTPDLDALRRKIGRLLMVGFRGLELESGSAIDTALRAGLGGVILFDRDQATGGARNIASPKQLLALTKALRAAATTPLLIAVDQEGGRVARLTPAYGFPATRSEAAIGATDDPDEALAAGRSMGRTMASVGIDLDLAPVVDLDIVPTNPAIGALDRSFSKDPAIVAAMADAEIRGLHEHDVRAVLKHFPGLGSATANTDFDRVDVTDSWTDQELDPYRSLFGLGTPDVVMVAHILQRHLDPKLPASLSPKVVDGLLRQQLGWTGPVITDSLGADAITSVYSQDEAVALAIEAGNDVLLFANQGTYQTNLARDLTETIVGLVRRGRITEARLDASVKRVKRLFGPID
jgi:beta-N-acetylhexosaminidase